MHMRAVSGAGRGARAEGGRISRGLHAERRVGLIP